MMLFVATTWALCTLIAKGAGTSVAELEREFNDVVEELVKAVELESCDERVVWLIVWLKPETLPSALLFGNTGAVFVLKRGPWDWAWAKRMATPPDDMNVEDDQ
jgi:hypothetical protein